MTDFYGYECLHLAKGTNLLNMAPFLVADLSLLLRARRQVASRYR